MRKQKKPKQRKPRNRKKYDKGDRVDDVIPAFKDAPLEDRVAMAEDKSVLRYSQPLELSYVPQHLDRLDEEEQYEATRKGYGPFANLGYVGRDTPKTIEELLKYRDLESKPPPRAVAAGDVGTAGITTRRWLEDLPTLGERVKEIDVTIDRLLKNNEFNSTEAEEFKIRMIGHLAREYPATRPPAGSKEDSQSILRPPERFSEEDTVDELNDRLEYLERMEYYRTGKRKKRQEGGMLEEPMAIPPEMEAMRAEPEEIPTEAPVSEVPVDTYPNATPEEVAAVQEPDEEIEEDYIEFIMNEALEPEEQTYLTNALEGDPQLSQIFDKVIETASEFSGSGEVQGPGDGITDSIPARLSDGEFVFTKKSADQLGPDNLQTLMDEAERAYDGGMMREGRYLGGALQDDEEDLGQYENRGESTDDEIRKMMSLRANKVPSLR